MKDLMGKLFKFVVLTALSWAVYVVCTELIMVLLGLIPSIKVGTAVYIASLMLRATLRNME